MSALVENMGEGLTPSEVQQLEDYEAIIARSLRGFVEVGEALAEIRDRRLYRAKFSSFEAYLAEKWPTVKLRHAYRLIEGAAIAADVSHGSHLPAPETERQARALAVVPEQERVPVWRESVERNGGKPAPSNVIEQVWKERQQPEQGEPESVEDRRAADFWNAERAKKNASPEPPPAPSNPILTSLSNEWYTPERYLIAAREVLGAIDLDPASCEAAKENVGARDYCGLDNGRDGLAEIWRGRVWLNPPYGTYDTPQGKRSNAGRWAAKLIHEYRAGNVTAAILCVNSLTCAPWFQQLWPYPICFTNHRIKFIGEDPDKDQPMNGTAFIYLGRDVEKFIHVFRQFGAVVTHAVPALEEV